MPHSDKLSSGVQKRSYKRKSYLSWGEFIKKKGRRGTCKEGGTNWSTKHSSRPFRKEGPVFGRKKNGYRKKKEPHVDRLRERHRGDQNNEKGEG